MTPFHEQLVTCDRMRISVDVYAETAHDVAVIVCPGFFQSKETATFRRMSEALAQGGRDVITHAEPVGAGRRGPSGAASWRQGPQRLSNPC